MSATFTIYNAAKFEIEICKSCDPKVGWLELSVTEVDGATHEITRAGDNRQRIDQMLRTYEFFERYIQH